MTDKQKETILVHLQNYRDKLVIEYEKNNMICTYHELREVNETIKELHS